MKKILTLLALLAAASFAVVLAQGPTVTPNVGFQIPSYQAQNWQVPINFNFNALDTILGGSSTLPVGTTTPLITGFSNWVTANISTEVITNFVGGYPGQTIRIICGTGARGPRSRPRRRSFSRLPRSRALRDSR